MFKGIPTAAAAAAFFQIIWSIRETPVGIVKTSDWQISQASFLRALKATSRKGGTIEGFSRVETLGF
jgi:hypothetical protein